MVGALLAPLTCYWRMKMPETTSYTTPFARYNSSSFRYAKSSANGYWKAEAQKLAAEMSNENAGPSANDLFSRDKNKTDARYPPGIGVNNSLLLMGWT
ncbi:hypothetical protein Csa_010633 [Cucumis sativus]|nr:hypothetical protein Csa_010633 [Cucumis sativus]